VGGLYVSFVVYHEFQKFPGKKEVVPPRDVGIGKSLVTSDSDQHGEGTRELRKVYGDLSRKEFLSKNWFKTKVKVA